MATMFCDWLTHLDTNGFRYRLPTSDEWFKACYWEESRKDWDYWWHASDMNDHLCCCNNTSGGRTRGRSEALEAFSLASHTSGDDTIVWHPSRESDRKGLIDILGNVWEWCANRHSESGSSRVLRGGSWYNSAGVCGSSGRYDRDPSSRNNLIGFRLCRELSS